jgi:hypothetical protein
MTDLLHRLEAAEFGIAGLATKIREDLVQAVLANRIEDINRIRDMLPAVIVLETVLKGIQSDTAAALLTEVDEAKEEEISEKAATELERILDGFMRILAQDRLIDESMIDLSHLPAATRQRLSKDLRISV